MNKPELLALARGERRRLELTLAALSEEQRLAPGVTGPWSVKDILAHIVAWEQRMLHWLQQTLASETGVPPPYGLPDADVDAWNERIYLERRAEPLPQVRAEFERSYRQALETVEGLPEEALADAGRCPGAEGVLPWMVVAANMGWHYREHEEAIRAWLQGREAA